ncbi:AarF/ABC1/UbiB kinase family protein [Marisediminicola antarctica]|uniref:AarF/ABC1/UbiB kinase family protein n=1 Tax=Marisediminicola antarctica TaxID=674079 RepID=UPI00192A4121|nr:AarF/ABC1/UbiB kinase family protein [Marisediminicola antarctica]
MRTVITEELGTPPEEFFSSFDPTPLASASIGQAHAATMLDATPVVVKVQRPGVIAEANLDLEVLQNLSAQASRHWELAADYNLTGIAAEFARTMREELDYLHEARNAERFAHNFAGDPSIHIPRIIWGATTSRVITLERIIGLNVGDADALDREGIDRRQLIERAVAAITQMVLVDGFVHADPHPGNLLVEPDGGIGLIDFGMVCVIDEQLREQITDLLLALTRNDPNRIGAALIELSVARGVGRSGQAAGRLRAVHRDVPGPRDRRARDGTAGKPSARDPARPPLPAEAGDGHRAQDAPDGRGDGHPPRPRIQPRPGTRTPCRTADRRVLLGDGDCPPTGASRRRRREAGLGGCRNASAISST